MSYLEIIEQLKTEPRGTPVTLSATGSGNEINEKNEISPLDGPPPGIETSLKMEPTKPSKAPDPQELVEAQAELPPLVGRKNARGQMVLTVEDLPELENRLRWQGWKVKRQGNELVCTSTGVVKIQ